MDSYTDNRSLIIANKHFVWLPQAELSILTIWIHHQFQFYVGKAGTY
jgi:hypothetical protein